MIILGIETSCDETAAAVVKAERGGFEILSNVVSSQVKVHAKYGGVVPEVAARLHMQKILPIIQLALRRAKMGVQDVTAIAVCSGPGLVSSLLVGVETAKTLAYVYEKPLVKVNHIEGHLLSAQGRERNQENTCPPACHALLGMAGRRCFATHGRREKSKNQSLITENYSKLEFPAVGLVVSGGHTQLILMKDYLRYKLIGETLDDAAGEAFDKAAKILGLGYPGGPAISVAAEKGQGVVVGLSLPRPMINSGDFQMSFSGLKTAVLYSWQKLSKGISGNELTELKKTFAYEFERAIVEVLTAKTVAAAENFFASTIILGGGVSANKSLRGELGRAIANKFPKVKFICPDLAMTGDNAAMIAIAAYYHIIKKDFVAPFRLKADPQWELV